MMTALIVDDEPMAVQRLSSMLETSGDVEVIGTAASVPEAELFLEARTPDVVFLDMTMPGPQGIELLPRVSPRTRVVFVTAYESYALTAFERGALDYLLKPFSRERLERTLQRLRDAIDSSRESLPPGPADGGLDMSGKVSFQRMGGKAVDRTALTDIAWVEALQNCSRVQECGRPPVVVTRSLAEWEKLLPPEQFARVGRSLIIQASRVRSMQWQSRNQTLLFFEDVEKPLPIGRAVAARVREILDSLDAGE